MPILTDKTDKIDFRSRLQARRPSIARYVVILLLASVLFGLNALLILLRK